MTEQQTEPMKAHELAYRLGIMMSAGAEAFTVRYYDSTVPFMVVDTGDSVFTLPIYGPSPKVTEAELQAATVAAEAAGAKAAAAGKDASRSEGCGIDADGWCACDGKDTGQKAGESTRPGEVLLCPKIKFGAGGCLLESGHTGPCEFPAAVHHPVGRAVVTVQPPFCAEPYDRGQAGPVYCTKAPGHDDEHGQGAE